MNDLQQKRTKIESFINSGEYRPMDSKDMAAILAVPTQAIGLFEGILADMLKDGALVLTRKGRYMSAAKMGLISGVFSATQKGYGFVLQTEAPDIFIPADATHTALHGDLVLCRITEEAEGKRSCVGEIVSVVERHKQHFVGLFELGERGGWVTPDDKRMGPAVHIPWKFINDAKDGEKVRVKIDKFHEDRAHEGRVEQVLGDPLDIGMDVLSLVVEHDIPYIFPDNALNQAQTMPHKVEPADILNRKDFRDLPTITIDGEDTKDIDDAISLERLKDGGYRLYVHIADVSHYVAPNTALWKEAQNRATSVYLADRVIPMLPPNLSNGICSLNPNVDRLALSCVMDLGEDGRVISHEICKSVIHSDHAVTYTTLADILTNENSLHRASYPGFADIFADMQALSTMLRQKRLHKGALEFEFAESKILIDSKGEVIDICRRERSIATSIIEEFMICANEVVATEYFWMDIPFVYRVHEEPDNEKIEALMTSLKSLGLSLKKGGGQAKNLQNLLERAQKVPQGSAVSKLILRSLKQARYYPQALGHFGLATEYYSHFTSPIRRFPDLLIHSIITANLAGRLDENYISLLRESLPDICKHSSENERRADDCAKDVEKLKKVQFMADKIGETFDGIITHTTPGGFFVELENTIEGMVAINSLTDDKYEYFDDHYSFKGRKNGRSFSLGDKVKIIATAAHLDLRRLDFELAPED
jgi:ribonuclease R